jgi:hypothetical protein
MFPTGGAGSTTKIRFSGGQKTWDGSKNLKIILQVIALVERLSLTFNPGVGLQVNFFMRAETQVAVHPTLSKPMPEQQ